MLFPLNFFQPPQKRLFRAGYYVGHVEKRGEVQSGDKNKNDLQTRLGRLLF